MRALIRPVLLALVACACPPAHAWFVESANTEFAFQPGYETARGNDWQMLYDQWFWDADWGDWWRFGDDGHGYGRPHHGGGDGHDGGGQSNWGGGSGDPTGGGVPPGGGIPGTPLPDSAVLLVTGLLGVGVLALRSRRA